MHPLLPRYAEGTLLFPAICGNGWLRLSRAKTFDNGAVEFQAAIGFRSVSNHARVMGSCRVSSPCMVDNPFAKVMIRLPKAGNLLLQCGESDFLFAGVHDEYGKTEIVVTLGTDWGAPSAQVAVPVLVEASGIDLASKCWDNFFADAKKSAT
jgi:hypothetical protein